MAVEETLAERIRQILARRKGVREKKMFGVGFLLNGIRGRSMKGWVLVAPEGVAGEEQLKDWVQRAVKYVGKLPAK
jgi:hypothetical protein